MIYFLRLSLSSCIMEKSFNNNEEPIGINKDLEELWKKNAHILIR